ncbi:MAG: hypothetical protein OGM10_04855 [Oscillospiraceae bacterium]|nr:hypothetical protein DW983_12765 [Ruminococcus sp. AM49-8]RGF98875.1 hypothetical protein DW977_12660 [Ruminococcus sp. AM49-10BH]UYJ38596.1 MAG: hypothetical protein OGM10_04855 [Oscillospiraceae bacterium]
MATVGLALFAKYKIEIYIPVKRIRKTNIITRDYSLKYIKYIRIITNVQFFRNYKLLGHNE